MTKNPKRWYKLSLISLSLFGVAYIFLNLSSAPSFSAQAQELQQLQEPHYDLNKIRLKIFHLLNFTAADNTLITPPLGKKLTPTPKPAGGSSIVLTRIYFTEGTTETTIGAGTYTPGAGYRLQLTRQVPLKNKSSVTNKYYLWLVKTSLTPPASERITLFDTAVLPPIDQNFAKNFSDYNELVVTEEDPSLNPSTPNLATPIFTAIQAPIIATPTPTAGPPSTPTPTPVAGAGSTYLSGRPGGSSTGSTGSLIEVILKRLGGLFDN